MLDYAITVVKITMLVIVVIWMCLTSEHEERSISTREKNRR